MAMGTNIDSLWWTSHTVFLSALQGGDPSTTSAKIDAHFDWLLSSVAGFRRPSEASRRMVSDQKTVSLKGKKLVIEPLLRPATLRLSALLDLDELQTHILLKRWIKETGQEGLLDKVADPKAQVGFGADALVAVMTYYHEERMALIKSLQYIFMQGVQDAALRATSARLVEAGIEDKLFENLRSNLMSGGAAVAPDGAAVISASPSAGGLIAVVPSTAPSASGSLHSRMSTIINEFQSSEGGGMTWISSVHATLRDQISRERCELLSLLLLFYELPAPLGIRCNSLRIVEIVKLLGTSMFPSASGQGTGCPELEEGGRAATPMLRRSVLGTPAAIAEHLACTLVLSLLDLPSYITLTSSPEEVPNPLEGLTLPAGGKIREVHNEICNWSGSETNAALLLTWSGLLQLVEPYIDLGGSSVEDLQSRAVQAGGFGSMASSLQQLQTFPNALGQLSRGVMLKAVCLISTAFELGPTTLTRKVFMQLLDLIRVIVEDDPMMSSAIWDSDLDLTQPLRAILRDTCEVFPAELSTLVQLLTILSQGPTSASRAYTFLQSAPHLAILHDVSDSCLQVVSALPHLDGMTRDREGAVVLKQATLWNQAPTVSTMVLPEGVEGRLVPLPAFLSDMEGQGMQLVVWDVRGTHRSFGQLLLLGRAAHCLHLVDRSVAARAPIDPTALRDLQDIIQLMANLCSAPLPGEGKEGDAILEDLMSLTVDLAHQGGRVKYTWLDVAAAATSTLLTLAAEGISSAPLSSSLSSCLKLIERLSSRNPLRTLSALEQIHILRPTLALDPRRFAPDPGHQPYPSVPLSSLPTFAVEDASLAATAPGLLPHLTIFTREIEAREGGYPFLIAVLDLVSSLMHRGHLGGPLSAYVLYVLHEVLPRHPQLPFKTAGARWKLTAAILSVLHAALKAGGHMAGPASSAGEGAGGLKREMYLTPLAAHILSYLTLHGAAALAPCFPPPAAGLEGARTGDGPSAAADVSSAEDAARELWSLLTRLLHAAAPFSSFSMIAPSSSGSELLPLESFLFHGSVHGTSTVSLIAGFVAYYQPPDGSLSSDDEAGDLALGPCLLARLSLGILSALLRSTATARQRGQQRKASSISGAPSATMASAAALASLASAFSQAGGAPREALCSFLRGGDPDSLLLLQGGVDLIEAAVEAEAVELLDTLFLPSRLDPAGDSEREGGAAVQPGEAGAVVVPPSTLAPKPPAAASQPPAAAAAWSALDSLHELLGRIASPRTKEEGAVCPRGRCHAMRALLALWQAQSRVLGGPVHLLRCQASTWAAVEVCVDLPSSVDEGGEVGGEEEGVWVHWAQAYALRVLTLEIHWVPRGLSEDNERIGRDVPSGGGPSHEGRQVWDLIDRHLLKGGRLAEIIRKTCEAPASQARVSRQLTAAMQACYLEIGACCLGGGLLAEDDPRGQRSAPLLTLQSGVETMEGSLPLSNLIRQELLRVRQGLAPGQAARVDIRAVHAALLKRMGEEEGVSYEEEEEEEDFLDGHSQALMALLARHPLGSTLWDYATTWSNDNLLLGSSLQEEMDSPLRVMDHTFLNPRVLLDLLGPPLVSQLASAETLISTATKARRLVLLGSARLAALRAACTLASLVPLKGTLTSLPPSTSPPLEGRDGGGLKSESILGAALEAASVGLSQLIRWGSEEGGEGGGGGGGGFSHRCHLRLHLETTLVSCRLLLQVLGASSRKQQTQASGSSLASPFPGGPSCSPHPYGSPRAGNIPEARTLFPATPPPASSHTSQGGTRASPHLGPASPHGGEAGIMAAACLPICSLLSSWLRSCSLGLWGGEDQEGEEKEVLQITEVLISSALLILPLVTRHGSRGTPADLFHLTLPVSSTSGRRRVPLSAHQGEAPPPDGGGGGGGGDEVLPEAWVGTIQAIMTDILPHLCKLCLRSSGVDQGHAVSVGLQLLTETIRHILPPSDWLPILAPALDIPTLLAKASLPGGLLQASSSSSSAYGDLQLGVLHLAALVAGTPPGAKLLYEQGALGQLTALAHRLLAAPPRGAGLAPFASLEFPVTFSAPTTAPFASRPRIASPATSSRAKDLSMVYQPATPGSSSLLGVDNAPEWSPAHREWCVVLSLSSTLVRTLGQHLGAGLENDAIELLTVAEPRLLLMLLPPSGTPGQPLTLAGLFETERALFLLTYMTRYTGAWQMTLPGSLSRFRTAASSFVTWVASSSSSMGEEGCPPQSEAERLMATRPTGLPRTEGWFRACSVGAAGQGQVLEKAGVLLTGQCSEYSARLAELMYTCTYQALSFLTASSPQVLAGGGGAEVASLGPMWPKPRDLAALQDQCMAVLYSMADAAPVLVTRGGGGRGGGVESGVRRRQCCQGVLRVLLSASDLLDAVGYPPNRRQAEPAIRQQISAVALALKAGEVLPCNPLVDRSPPLSPMGSPLSVM